MLDASTGLPLAYGLATLQYMRDTAAVGERATWWGGQVQADGNGRFRIGTVIPGSVASISIAEPNQPGVSRQVHKPDLLQRLVVDPGEVRDIGDIRLNLSAAAKPKAR